jgi:hypothetical protein
MTDTIAAATLRVVTDRMNHLEVIDIPVVHLSEALWSSHLERAAYRDRILSLECFAPATVPATMYGRGGKADFSWLLMGDRISVRVEVNPERSAQEALRLLVGKIDEYLRAVASRTQHELDLAMQAALGRL